MTHHIRDRKDTFRFRTFEDGRLSFVSGVFNEVADAEKAVVALERRGFGREQITVLMPERVRARYLNESPALDIEKGNKAAKGLGAGSAIGGAVGAILGAIAAAGTTLIIPGLGLVVAGPIAAALAGAGAGGATGGVLGALVGAGLPEYRAKYYEDKIKEGSIVVGVEARNEEEIDTIEDELKDSGADDVKEVETATRRGV
jgi:hypothetical protein